MSFIRLYRQYRKIEFTIVIGYILNFCSLIDFNDLFNCAKRCALYQTTERCTHDATIQHKCTIIIEIIVLVVNLICFHFLEIIVI